MASTKRKATTVLKDGPEASSRAQRKRVQNRISQKCHRERQAAHARHLESLVDVIKTGDQEGSNATSNDRYTALLQRHMKVLEEKRELEEVVFRMRKKLLSISNSAAAAAGDDSGGVLHSKNRTTTPHSAPTPPSPSPPASRIESGNEGTIADVQAQSPGDTLPLHKATATDAPKVSVSSEEPQRLDLADGQNTLTPSTDLVLPSVHWLSDAEQQREALIGTITAQLALPDRNYPWSLGVWDPACPFDYPRSTPAPTKTVTITSATIFAETILSACKKYVGLYMSKSDHQDGPTICPDFAGHGWSEEAQETSHVAQISAIAVHMLSAYAGLEGYVYGVGGASIMESIMRWRLKPTFDNRMAIPEPFRPTPLQYSTCDYPLFVDFVNWPAIRDQLILQSQNIDTDEVIRDLVYNTVVEIPHRRKSVNVLSLFDTSIGRPGDHMTMSHGLEAAFADAQWKYLEIAAPLEADLVSSDADSLAERALLQEISRRMDNGSIASWSDKSNPLRTIDAVGSPNWTFLPMVNDSLAGSWSRAAHRRNEIIARFGLDQVRKWKLSKAFARKHSYLDCSSAVTTYDMVSAQSVLEADATA